MDPMLGTVGVAPAAGEVRSSLVPDAFGGNMDTPEMRAGASCYLGVNVPGALFSVGDGHCPRRMPTRACTGGCAGWPGPPAGRAARRRPTRRPGGLGTSARASFGINVSARAAVFLASPAASFVTGANLLVDGALTRGVQF